MSGYISDGKLIIVTDHKGLILREIEAEMKVVYKAKYGREWKVYGFDLLSSSEQEWVIHTASVNVQNKRRGRKQG